MQRGRPNARIGAVKPVSFSLTKALGKLKAAGYRLKGEEQGFYALGASETLILGRLINSWRSIVGAQLAKKTYPSRYLRKKLYLTVADSQWMQTLLFYKAEILKKIGEAFSDIKITDIVTRVGQIPKCSSELSKDSKQPNWKSEKNINFEQLGDKGLKNLISRCAKKSFARLKSLQQNGFALCKICKSKVTASKTGICAVCSYNSHLKSRQSARAILYDMPWLSLEDFNEIDSSLLAVEIDSIRQKLLNETLSYIDELYCTYSSELADINLKDGVFTQSKYLINLHQSLIHEMTRAVMLNRVCRPEDVDFNVLTPEQMPFKGFNAAVKLVVRGEMC